MVQILPPQSKKVTFLSGFRLRRFFFALRENFSLNVNEKVSHVRMNF